MNLEILNAILDLEKREDLFLRLMKNFEEFSKINHVNYKEFETSEGKIPIIFLGETLDADKVKNVKLFIGAQHNEYNGLFGILRFFELIKNKEILISDLIINKQLLIFAPLMNPYGFIYPSKDNKSGYYLKNGTNLNRFWRRTFVPEYQNLKNDLAEFPIPEHAKIIKNILQDYWHNEEIAIYILDIHETSLLDRFPLELSLNLNRESVAYKFDHWLKEGIIKNVIKLYNIPCHREPLFRRCYTSADHTHLNLSMKQIDLVYEKLLEYIVKNQGKARFYFCYSDKSETYCEKLAKVVYEKLKDKLVESYYVAFNHHFHDHGCFVKMNDASYREKVYTIELESQKQFFDLFKEIEDSKTDPIYFSNKLSLINITIELVIETIIGMIKLF